MAKDLMFNVSTRAVSKLTTPGQRQTACSVCGQTLYAAGLDYFRIGVLSQQFYVCGKCGNDGVLETLKKLKKEVIPALVAAEKKRIFQEEEAKHLATIKQKASLRIKQEIPEMLKGFFEALNHQTNLQWERMRSAEADCNRIVEKQCPKCERMFSSEAWKEVCLDCWQKDKEYDQYLSSVSVATKRQDVLIKALEDSRGMKELHRETVRFR
jgi:uncharacterized protein YbaR (Trm112 family)